MSIDGSTLLKWPDDERRYRLGIGELQELQEKTNRGPAEIFTRLSQRTWWFNEVRETIRLGLIGGGLDPQRALALVGRYVVPGQLMVCSGIAQAILYAALIDETNSGKDDAGTETTSQAVSSSRQSTEPAPSSDGLPAKSTNAHSLNSLPQ